MLFGEGEVFLTTETLSVKTYNHNTFAMLWNISLAIHYFVVDRVIQLFQCFAYNTKRITFIVRSKVLHIFQIKGFGAMAINNISYIEKQCSLCLVFESGGASKTFLL